MGELIDLEEYRGKADALFNTLNKTFRMDSLMCAAIHVGIHTSIYSYLLRLPYMNKMWEQPVPVP